MGGRRGRYFGYWIVGVGSVGEFLRGGREIVSAFARGSRSIDASGVDSI